MSPKPYSITSKKGNLQKRHNLYTSQNIIRKIKSRRMKLIGHMTSNIYRVLVRKLDGKRSLRKPKHG
jgi:hypothetical protein